MFSTLWAMPPLGQLLELPFVDNEHINMGDRDLFVKAAGNWAGPMGHS